MSLIQTQPSQFPYWLPWVVTAISGGAAGALITATITHFRNRIQPVGYRIDVRSVFRGPAGAGMAAQLTVADNGRQHQFDNLFLAEIEIVNKGNQDVKSFPFGITLNGGDLAIFLECSTPDRHHTARVVTAVAPGGPLSAIDIVVEPFNRGDVYRFITSVVVPPTASHPSAIALGSPNAVRFTDLPTFGELVLQAAAERSIRLGPIRLGLSKFL